jgi:hypothetical protein
MFPTWRSLMLAAASLVVATAPAPARADDPAEFFERRVRPLLVERCQECHGAGKIKGGLRLTSRAAILEGGDIGPAAEPGKPDESLLIQAVRYRDDALKMPPTGKLGDAEIAVLEQWVALGLPFSEGVEGSRGRGVEGEGKRGSGSEHWAFRPMRAVEAPEVVDSGWARTAVDRFILAKLEAAGLAPAPSADKRTLIRRVTFDLTGLPPTPEEVEAFVRDETPVAYEKLVDRLLASPHHGERWARHWLDVVRYADSLDSRGSGQPGDILDAWRYRDWVVGAFNADMPFDKFARYQIAGDLLPPDSAEEGTEGFNRSGTIATTLLAIGNWGNGDADKDKILTDIADDQVDVVSKAFLGLTVACARCHDHKFDPISQADYYGLAGIFFSTHILPKLTPKGAGETIIRVPLASPAEMERRAQRERRIAELKESLAKRRAECYGELARALKPQAGRYLLAAQDYQTRPDDQASVTPEDFAARRELLGFALRNWIEAIEGGAVTPIPARTTNVGGRAGVLAWTGPPGFASATANTTGERLQVQTFTLPPRSISVHPGPRSAAVVSWRSPINGAVRITGRVADGDGAAGNGVAWSIDRRGRGGAVELASGDVPNGGAQAFAQASNADALARVEVRPGDRINLIVMPKNDYTCDTTTVELLIASWDGPEIWDLTRDCLADFHAANPHADRLGNAGVWQFGDAPGAGAPAGPLASALTPWREAIERGADRAEIERAAEAVAAAFALEDAASPFWIQGPADEVALPSEARAELDAIAGALADLESHPPAPLEFANAAQEGGVPESPHAGAHDVAIHIRGRYDRLGESVPRHFPAVLGGGPDTPITQGSGRVELADWLTRPDHRLTARVIANRLWQHHFGAGIVHTPSNFGKLGAPPTHPELLDYLALRLVDEGWSLKRLHREIVLSSTYQQSSAATSETIRLDPENRLFSRQGRRRLEAETIRDNLLAVSGRLDAAMGGPADRDFNRPRRGLYAITIRSDRATFGALFDQADSTAPVDARVESTIAPQALFLLNSPFVLDQAAALAARLIREAGDDPARIERAYALLYGRPPGDAERAIGLDALRRARAVGDGDEAAWTAYAQVLLCANEFLYID